MIFDRLFLENLLSIGECEIKFGINGIVSVIGINNDTETSSSNGAGKTAIFDGLLWTIYGQILRSLDMLSTKPSVDWSGRMDKDVQNIYTDGKVKGELEFHNDKHHYKIVRTLNGTRLWQDGEPFEDKSKAGTENKILELFPPIGLFCTMVYIGDRSPFRFSKWSSKERTEALEYLIDLSAYEKAYNKVKKVLKDLGSKQSELTQHSTNTDNKINIEEGKLGTIKETLEDCNSQLKRFEEESRVSQDKIDDLKTELNKLAEMEDKGVLELTLSGLSEEGSEASEDASKISSSIAVAKAESDRLQKEKERFEKLGDSCPTCKQKISQKLVDSVNKEKDDKIKTQIDLLEGYIPIQHEVTDRIITTKREMSSIKDKLSKLQDGDTLRSRISSLEEVISRGKSSITDTADDQIKKLENIKNILDELTDQSDDLANELTDIEEEIDYYEFWETGYSSKGLRSYKLDTVIDWLNTRMHVNTCKLFGNDMSILLNPEKELKSGDRRNEISLDVDYSGRQYSKLSSGEYNRVDFLVHLALRDMAEHFSRESFNILVIDEIFGTLDGTALSYVKDLLKDFSKDVEVWVSSHIDQLQTMGDKKCTVTKDANVSSVDITK